MIAAPAALSRALAGLAALALLAACEAKPVEESPMKDLGDFRLGYAIVVADSARPVPPTRPATDTEWENALRSEIDRRLRRYEGGRLYHLAVAVDGFSVAVPGLPVVASPKSVLAVSVTLFDDADRAQLNPEAKQLIIMEGSSGDTFVGSGLTRRKDEQIGVLSKNAVAAIEAWLAENEAWFRRYPPRPPEEVAEIAQAAAKAAAASASLPAAGGTTAPPAAAPAGSAAITN